MASSVLALIVAPTAVLMNSLGDLVRQLVQTSSRARWIPPPSTSVADWPMVGPQVHAMWSQAHADLPALVKGLQPKLGDMVTPALGFVAGIGVGLLLFLVAFIIAGIVMAFGEEGPRASQTIFGAGSARGVATNSSRCRSRRFARSPSASSVSRSSRPSSSECACWWRGFRWRVGLP